MLYLHKALQYIAEEALVGLSSKIEKEKVIVIAGYLSLQLIGPILRIRDVSKMQLIGLAMKIATNLLPASFALKVWKRDMWNVFMDPKFFNLGLEALKSWKVIVHGMISSESDLLVEILSKILTPSKVRDHHWQWRDYPKY